MTQKQTGISKAGNPIVGENITSKTNAVLRKKGAKTADAADLVKAAADAATAAPKADAAGALAKEVEEKFTITKQLQKSHDPKRTRGVKVATPLVEEGPICHVGLDVHAADFVAAIAEPRRGGEVRELGTFTCDLHAWEKLMARLRKAHPEGSLHVAYEAGPTGFVFARRLAQLGIACMVAAPSLMPVRPGERIKTDRRDARKLVLLYHKPSSNSDGFLRLLESMSVCRLRCRRARAFWISSSEMCGLGR